MNIFSRALICALLLGGTSQPIDWKYIFPCVATIICLGGSCFYLIQQNNLLQKTTSEKDGQIRGLQLRLESKSEINDSKKDSRARNIKSTPDSEEVKRLQAELTKKEEEIAEKEKTIKEQNKFYDNFWPLLDATSVESMGESKKYTVTLNKLKKEVIVNFKVEKESFEVIKESALCAPYKLVLHPVVKAILDAKNEKFIQARDQDSITMAYHNQQQIEAMKVLPPPLPSVDPQTNRNSLSEFKGTNFDLLRQNLTEKTKGKPN